MARHTRLSGLSASLPPASRRPGSVYGNSATQGIFSAMARAAARTAWSTESRSTPGMESTGILWPVPSTRNSGQIRSSTVSMCSRTIRRAQSARRLRRGRVARSSWVSVAGRPASGRSASTGASRTFGSIGRPYLIAMRPSVEPDLLTCSLRTQPGARGLLGGSRFPRGGPQLAVIGEAFQRVIAVDRVEPGQHPAHAEVHHRGGVADVEVDRVEDAAQVEFRIVVQPAAAEPLVAVDNRPGDHVADGVMIVVQVECDRIVESDIFGIELVTLHHAHCEGHDASFAAPQEEAHLVRHQPPEPAQIVLRQLFEVIGRAMIDLQIERKNLVDHRGDVADDSLRDRRPGFGGLEFEPEIAAAAAAQRLDHVFLEIVVIDVQARHGKARHARVAVVHEALQARAVACRKFLEGDEADAETARLVHQGGGKQAGVAAVLAVEVAFAGRRSHHQDAHAHETWPQPADIVGEPTDGVTLGFEQVLVHDEERLHRVHRAGRVDDHEIAIVEAIDRLFHQLEMPAVLALREERVRPAGALRQLGAGCHRQMQSACCNTVQPSDISNPVHEWCSLYQAYGPTARWVSRLGSAPTLAICETSRSSCNHEVGMRTRANMRLCYDDLDLSGT